MHVSDKALAMLELEEGVKLKSYPDPATGGVPWTIGVGLTTDKSIGVIVGPGMTLTPAQERALLRRYVAAYEGDMNKLITRTPPQNVFDAMFLLTWNIGRGKGGFATSHVLKDWNAGKQLETIATDFMMWVHPSMLIERRKREVALLLHGLYRSS